MRVLPSFVGIVLLLAALGCQSKSETMTSGEPDSDQTTIAQTQPTLAEKNAESESTVMADVEQLESENGQVSGTTGHGPRGIGRGMGRGMGRGPGAMPGMQDMTTLHAMFADRDKIKRTVTNLPDGAEAVTESADEEIASMIQEHVPAMEDRVHGNNPLPPMKFHPIFVELIKHSGDYSLAYEETAKGMQVKYTSEDPYVVMLVQEHAKLVSRFIKNGMVEIHKPYTLPKLESPSRDEKSDGAEAASVSRKRRRVAEQAKDERASGI